MPVTEESTVTISLYEMTKNNLDRFIQLTRQNVKTEQEREEWIDIGLSLACSFAAAYFAQKEKSIKPIGEASYAVVDMD